MVWCFRSKWPDNFIWTRWTEKHGVKVNEGETYFFFEFVRKGEGGCLAESEISFSEKKLRLFWIFSSRWGVSEKLKWTFLYTSPKRANIFWPPSLIKNLIRFSWLIPNFRLNSFSWHGTSDWREWRAVGRVKESRGCQLVGKHAWVERQQLLLGNGI